MELVDNSKKDLVTLLSCKRLTTADVVMDIRRFNLNDCITQDYKFVVVDDEKRLIEKLRFQFYLDVNGGVQRYSDNSIMPNYIWVLGSRIRKMIDDYELGEDDIIGFKDLVAEVCPYMVSKEFAYGAMSMLCHLFCVFKLRLVIESLNEVNDDGDGSFRKDLLGLEKELFGKFVWFRKTEEKDYLNLLTDVNFYLVRFNPTMSVETYRCDSSAGQNVYKSKPNVEFKRDSTMEVSICYLNRDMISINRDAADSCVVFFSHLVRLSKEVKNPVYVRSKSKKGAYVLCVKKVPNKFYQNVCADIMGVSNHEIMLYFHKRACPIHMRYFFKNDESISVTYSNCGSKGVIQTGPACEWIIKDAAVYLMRYINALYNGKKMSCMDTLDFAFSCVDILNHYGIADIDFCICIARIVFLWSCVRTIGFIKGCETIIKGVCRTDTCDIEDAKRLLWILPSYYMLADMQCWREYRIIETLLGPSGSFGKAFKFYDDNDMSDFKTKMVPRGIFRREYVGVPYKYDDCNEEFYGAIYEATKGMTSSAYDYIETNSFLMNEVYNSIDTLSVRCDSISTALVTVLTTCDIDMKELLPLSCKIDTNAISKLSTAARLLKEFNDIYNTFDEQQRSLLDISPLSLNYWLDKSVSSSLTIMPGGDAVILSDHVNGNSLHLNGILSEEKKTLVSSANYDDTSLKDEFYKATLCEFDTVYSGTETISSLMASIHHTKNIYTEEDYNILLTCLNIIKQRTKLENNTLYAV